MSKLNENFLGIKLAAVHTVNHSLICNHDHDDGERYRVRMDVWGSDHRRDAEAIVERVNGFDALKTVLCGRLGLDPERLIVTDGRVFINDARMTEVTP